MANLIKEDDPRVKPLKITDHGTNTAYTLDFSRDSIRFAEAREFKINEVSDYPVTKIPELWYYAFRMNHKNLSRTQTDALLEELGGVTPAILERLVSLYVQAAESNNIIQTEEDMGKNSRVTVELD